MTGFDVLSLDRLRLRRSEKWTRYPADVLPSTPAETDFSVAPAIRAVLADAVARGDLGYANAKGSRVAEAFAGFASRRWDWKVDPDAVVALPEIMVGVAELLRVLTVPGDGIVITTPVYPPFFSVIAEVGRRVIEAPLLPRELPGRLPLEGIRQAFADGARVLLLCNPHNPTGYVAARDELLELSEIVAERNGVILSDEIHAPLTLGGATHVPFSSLPGEAAESAITLASASKGWNIPGLKCALAVAGSDSMRSALARLPKDLPDRVGHLGVLATQAAYAEGEDWLDDLLPYLDENRRTLQALLADHLPLVRYEPGAASYLAWLDCRASGLGSDPAAHFLTHGRVALTPGQLFGTSGQGFARLNFATSRPLLTETVTRLAHAAAAPRAD
jgi:cystathionine beta-lyase